jgi:hypothetical protein
MNANHEETKGKIEAKGENTALELVGSRRGETKIGYILNATREGMTRASPFATVQDPKNRRK